MFPNEFLYNAMLLILTRMALFAICYYEINDFHTNFAILGSS